MVIELKELGLEVISQYQIEVFYKNHPVGTYFADLLIDKKIIVELKATESLCQEHECQLINYLKATNIEIGLLLNFGKEPQFSRKIFSNSRKSVKSA